MEIVFEDIELVWYQEEFLYCEEQYTFIDAASKAGKTQPMLLWILQIACNEDPNWNWEEGVEGKNFWWVAPVSTQANIAFERLQKMVKEAPGFTVHRSRGEERITTPLKSIIWFKSGDKPDSLYGEDVYGAVVDEHSRCKQASWTALLTTTTATEAPIKLIGNYKGDSNWSAIMKRKVKDDPNWKVMTVPANLAVEAGIIKQSSLDRISTTMPRADFMAVYYCIGSIDQFKIFETASIDNFFTNKHVLINNPSTMYMICDLAYLGADFFIIHIWKGNVLISRQQYEKTGGLEIIAHIDRNATEYGVMRSNICYDATGAQWLSSSDGNSGFLDGAVQFVGGGRAKDPVAYHNKRAESYYEFAAELRHGKLYCQDDSNKEGMSEELEAQRRKDAPRGKIMMERKEMIKGILGGRSPDDADCLSMRTVFPIGPPKNTMLEQEDSGLMVMSF